MLGVERTRRPVFRGGRVGYTPVIPAPLTLHAKWPLLKTYFLLFKLKQVTRAWSQMKDNKNMTSIKPTKVCVKGKIFEIRHIEINLHICGAHAYFKLVLITRNPEFSKTLKNSTKMKQTHTFHLE